MTEPSAANYPEPSPPVQPGPPPAGYQVPPPYPYGYPAARKTNTMAIVALVLCFVFFPAGLICGYLAKKEIERTGEDGEGLAKAAIIIGWVHVAFLVLVCGGMIAFFGFFAATAGTTT